MNMRTTLGAVGLLVAGTMLATGCKPEPDGPGNVGGDIIACTIAGSSDTASSCQVDRVRQDGRLFLVVRHPDGAFRRFEVLDDGRGLAVADGADEARLNLVGDVLHVAVGSDVYDFPATVRSVNVAEK